MMLYEDLNQYDLIFTPNERLCNAVTQEYKHFSDTPPPVYSLSRWIKHQQGGPNPHQALLLWKQALPGLAHLAPLAQAAWEVCTHWLLDINHPLFSTNEDTRLFQHWVKKVGFNNKSITPPRNSCFIGFGELTPLEKKLMGNSPQPTCQAPKKQTVLQQTIFNTSEEELKAMAIWAASQPHHKTIGCVVPNLHDIRDTVDYYFGQYLADKNRYSISMDKKLSDYPLIQDCLTGLNLLRENTPLQSLSQFLLSPFFEGLNPVLEKKMREKYPVMIPRKLLPLTLLALPEPQKPSDWAIFFQQQLDLLGFPGKRNLNSEEQLLLTQFQEVLLLYKKFDTVASSAWDLEKALEELTGLLSRLTFQPDSSPNANIHILGIFESAGLHFDALWVMGLHNAAWPLTLTSNPFIPFEYATAEKALQISKNIMAQWKTAAESVIFSSPRTQADQQYNPSILLRNICIKNKPDMPVLLTPAEQLFSIIKPIKPENINISNNIAPELNISTLKHHGSSLLKDQAACPFRAFARHRLHAKKIDRAQLGLKALERGNIVHEIMEKIWKTLQNQQNLLDYSDENLAELIDTCINNSFSPYTFIPQKIFLSTEKIRLQKLITQWLLLEKTRGNFQVIATEETLEAYLGKLPLKLRIDRIDKIGDNHYLIIDYKTGKQNISPDPMDEPQLPLYCVISALKVESIGMGYIRTGNSRLKIRNIQSLKQSWEQQLTQLAEDFIQGKADVHPKYGEQTCRQCDLHALCRIQPLQ